MADRIPAETSPSLTSLLSGIVTDMQTLLRQEVTLARTEIVKEWDKAKTAAGSMAVGAALLALGGILLSLMVVHLIQWATQWHEWICYLIVGGVAALLGAVLFYAGRAKAGDVNVIPQQTAEVVKENLGMED